MRKRLVKQGHSTLTLTIPAAWVKEHRLKPGDEVELDIGSRSLIVSTTGLPTSETLEIDVRGLHITGLKWLLAAAYKKGYDHIIVTYSNNQQLKAINDRIKDCLKNYEIMGQGNSTVTIRSISNATDESFEALLRRIFLVNLSFFKSVQEALQHKSGDQLLEATYLEDTNDSLVNTCQRMLIKNKHVDTRDAPFYFVIIWQLEKIADSLKHFCQEMHNQKKWSADTVREFTVVVDLFETFYTLCYSFDPKKLDGVIAKKKGMLSALDQRENYHLRHLCEQILDLSGPYFALKLAKDP